MEDLSSLSWEHREALLIDLGSTINYLAKFKIESEVVTMQYA